MPKEAFPHKRKGDGLSATHVNSLGRVATNLSGGNQGSGQQGTSGWITGSAVVQKMTVVIAKIVEETSEDGIYEITLRYWDETNRLWKDFDDEYLLDARCFSEDTTYPQSGMSLSEGKRLSVRYDKHRGMFVPIAEPGGTGGAEIISFRVLSVGPFVGETSAYCLTVLAEVTDVSCNGATVSIGDEIVIWDTDSCYFNVPRVVLVGMRGHAVKMSWGDTSDDYTGTGTSSSLPLPGEQGGISDCVDDLGSGTGWVAGECWWKVIGLCCGEEVYY